MNLILDLTAPLVVTGLLALMKLIGVFEISWLLVFTPTLITAALIIQAYVVLWWISP